MSVRSAAPETGIVPARGSVSDAGVPRFSPEAYRSRFATPSSAGAERSSLRSGSVNSAAVKFCPCHSAKVVGGAPGTETWARHSR